MDWWFICPDLVCAWWLTRSLMMVNQPGTCLSLMPWIVVQGQADSGVFPCFLGEGMVLKLVNSNMTTLVECMPSRIITRLGKPTFVWQQFFCGITDTSSFNYDNKYQKLVWGGCISQKTWVAFSRKCWRSRKRIVGSFWIGFSPTLETQPWRRGSWRQWFVDSWWLCFLPEGFLVSMEIYIITKQYLDGLK